MKATKNRWFLKPLLSQVINQFFPNNQEDHLTCQAFSKLSERYRLLHFLSYRYMDDYGIWLADNPYGMDSFLIGFEITPMIVAGDKAIEKLTSMIHHLPEGSVIHSIAHGSPYIQPDLEGWVLSRHKVKHDEIYDEITQRRTQYLINWSQGKHQGIKGEAFKPRMIRYYWFVRIPSSYHHYEKKSLSSFQSLIQQLRNFMISEFSACRIKATSLSGKKLLYCLKCLIQTHRDSADIQEDRQLSSASVSQQLLSPSMKIKLGHGGELCFLDSVNHKAMSYKVVLSAIQFPQTPFYLSSMAECLGSSSRSCDFIDANFYTYTVIQVLNRESVTFKAGKKMALLQYQTACTQEFWKQIMRPLYRRKEHVQSLYHAFDKEGERPVKVWSGVVLASKSKLALEKSIGVCQSLWKSIGIDLYQESRIHFPAWIATLPGQYRQGMDEADQGLQRGITMQAKHAAMMVHIQGDWKGSPMSHGGLLALSRRGVLTNINLFDTYKSNYNGVVAASSGSGKSFMVNDLSLDFLARGGSVRIIDAGRSYYNTAEILGGQNLVFDRSSACCINPFSELHTLQDLQEDMDILVSLVAQMAFPFGFGQVGQQDAGKSYEYRAIEASIENIWSLKKSKMSVRDIADYFLNSHHIDLQRIGEQLRPWAYGRYAVWMVGESNINFNNAFLVLELDELSDEPELQAVILNLLLARIARSMYLESQKEIKCYGRRLPKLIVIDEAWDLLSRPNTGAFIEKAYRRARKYYCSMLIVTQSFTDCDKTSAARAALSNANWIISLVHDLGALQQATQENLLNISAYSQSKIASLQKTEDYAEFYIFNKSLQGEGLYRLIVDPESYFMYTTDASERDAMTKLLHEGYGLKEAIHHLKKTAGK